MRKCFICDSTNMCEHREPDLCTKQVTIDGPLFRTKPVLVTRKPVKKETPDVEKHHIHRID